MKTKKPHAAAAQCACCGTSLCECCRWYFWESDASREIDRLIASVESQADVITLLNESIRDREDAGHEL